MPVSDKPRKKRASVQVPGQNPDIQRRGGAAKNAPRDAPKTVALTFCSGDMVHADFACSLVMLTVATRRAGIYTMLCNPKASEIDVGRTNGVRMMRQMKADFIFFVDSDVMTPPHTIAQLVSHDKDVIGGSYCQRRLPHKLTHTDLDGVVGRLRDDEIGIKQIMRLPAGCLLIKKQVFDAMQEAQDLPFFRKLYPGGERHISEDNAFCDRARNLGFEVWLDCDITRETVHLGQYGYRWSDAIDTDDTKRGESGADSAAG